MLRMESVGVSALPIVDGAVLESIHGQVSGLVAVFASGGSIQLHAEAHLVSGMQQAVLKPQRGAENVERLVGVAHVLLDAKVVESEVQVKVRCLPNRRHVCGPVETRLDAVDGREIRNLL